MVNTQDPIQQNNIGQNQRVAGRDFNDQSVTYYADLKFMMLTLNETKLDQMSINNSDLFKRRFGKNLEKHWRKKIVDLKLEYDLTRRQAKSLLLVRAIRINDKTNGVDLEHDKVVYWYGLLHIIMISLYSLAGSIVVLHSSAPLINRFLGQLTIAATWGITVWVFHFMFIYPHKLLERIRLVNVEG